MLGPDDTLPRHENVKEAALIENDANASEKIRFFPAVSAFTVALGQLSSSLSIAVSCAILHDGAYNSGATANTNPFSLI